MQAHEQYIAKVLLGRGDISLELARSDDIESMRAERCLSASGASHLNTAIRYYLAGRRDEADEVLGIALAFLDLAHSIQERNRYNYTRHWSEGDRSAGLSLARWLSGVEVGLSLLADARTHFAAHYKKRGAINRLEAGVSVPKLLYIEAYDLIRFFAERLGIGTQAEGRRKSPSILARALKVATASSPDERVAAKEKLRRWIVPKLFENIDRGSYTDAAYTLHALFPHPDGPHSQLIENCWQYIPEELIAKRLLDRQL